MVDPATVLICDVDVYVVVNRIQDGSTRIDFWLAGWLAGRHKPIRLSYYTACSI